MRTQRTNGSVTYTYLYNGSQLTQMTRGSVVMRFSYGTDGRPLVISYNDVPYYYITNLQGDVVAIVNSSGTTVVSYVYDAWGRLISTDDDTDIDLGEINPLRYRGYVYDHETGLYYLQSRYYNPTWGRFLNADAYVSTGQGLLGNNMFAYCTNNPVNNADHSGCYGICVLSDPMNAYRSFLTPGMFGGGGSGSVAGVSSSYYAQQNVRAYDSWWRNSCYNVTFSGWESSGNLIIPDSEPFLPDSFYSKHAPKQSTPYSSYTKYTYDKFSGKYETSTAYYDLAGRQIIRIDWTNHGYSDHGDPHVHYTTYSSQYRDGTTIRMD